MVFIPMIWLNQMFCFFQKSKYLPKSELSLFVDVTAYSRRNIVHVPGVALSNVLKNRGRRRRIYLTLTKFTNLVQEKFP